MRGIRKAPENVAGDTEVCSWTKAKIDTVNFIYQTGRLLPIRSIPSAILDFQAVILLPYEPD
jgi:hypothetical protein